ncbi:zinc-ribbon domain-containing protein [Alkalihalobacillus sp. AL-G]|uniref:FxLYD domain-containing protein n=1 Tax=Alkalihalobacillus sp. AL-G TaxID=2926399 RepID=UPI00272BEC76|nr:zinc-ribbon domain-containing protein [Alkalihalobacillus sp. AL-G]WLD93241.1 zinc ribbon domain-containing protein [Alkalihalobacillus sp. AL-G]
MYCSNCGNQLQHEEKFCQSCGAKRSSNVETSPPPRRKWYWLVPLLTFFIIAGSLGSYVFAERAETDTANDAFEKGEQLALKGDYKKAKQSFQYALTLRGNFDAAKRNITLMETAINIEERLHKAKQQQEDHAFEKAINEIKHAEAMISGFSGELITQIEQEIKKSRITTNVAQLRFEMKGKSSIEELEPILVKAERLDIPEAEQIANKIRMQIADFAYTIASDLLKDKQFSAALASVTKGLSYEPDNGKLLNLKTTIKSEQEAFEQAEQNRIEQALLAASKEKEHNLNNAIEVTEIQASLNEFGDIIVAGTVKSNATVPVTSIMISYTLFQKDGQEYGENEAYVFPDVLYPGETGSFEYTHFLVNEALNVKLNEATWYLQ